METTRFKPPKFPPIPLDPARVATAKKFLEETNWDKYWVDLSERMQDDAVFNDFSFILHPDQIE